MNVNQDQNQFCSKISHIYITFFCQWKLLYINPCFEGIRTRTVQYTYFYPQYTVLPIASVWSIKNDHPLSQLLFFTIHGCDRTATARYNTKSTELRWYYMIHVVRESEIHQLSYGRSGNLNSGGRWTFEQPWRTTKHVSNIARSWSWGELHVVEYADERSRLDASTYENLTL